MAFKFRLAKVLGWYEEQCKSEENRLRDIATALDSLLQRVVGLHKERDRVEAEMIQNPSVSPSDLAALASFQDHTRKQESYLVMEGAKLRTALEDQRKVVQAARRRVRLLEKLRERRLAEHSYLLDRELEQMAADAFQSSSFSKQSGAN